MHREHLNEHDGNQGAQSQGEFLGMAGNAAWYLLGAIGLTQLFIVFLWGMLGVSLTFCLGLGGALCLAALGYVFALKNNRPAHYDTDFFESALIEAGVLALSFGPSETRPRNPFRSVTAVVPTPATRGTSVVGRCRPAPATARRDESSAAISLEARPPEKSECKNGDGPTVPLAVYERLRAELHETEDRLEEAALAEKEDGVCA